MTSVFADTLYWVAVAAPRDQWHQPALTARALLGPVQIITTDEILVEFLTALSTGGPFFAGQSSASTQKFWCRMRS